MNLIAYQKVIDDLALKKKWNRNPIWLERQMFHELGEMLSAIDNNLGQDEIAEEAADFIHFFLQDLSIRAPKVDLDKALWKKINSNRVTKKKTLSEDGKIVRK